MKQHKNPKITAVCAFCEHALWNTENSEMLCRYKKNAMPDSHCRRFLYDPLKHIPKRAPNAEALDPASVLTNLCE